MPLIPIEKAVLQYHSTLGESCVAYLSMDVLTPWDLSVGAISAHDQAGLLRLHKSTKGSARLSGTHRSGHSMGRTLAAVELGNHNEPLH